MSDGGQKQPARRKARVREEAAPYAAARPSAVVDTRVIYRGNNLDQLRRLTVSEILNEHFARKLA